MTSIGDGGGRFSDLPGRVSDDRVVGRWLSDSRARSMDEGGKAATSGARSSIGEGGRRFSDSPGRAFR